MSKIIDTKQFKAGAEAAKKFFGGLIGELAGTVASAMVELEAIKADKPSAISITIPTTGWKSDSNAVYPKYYDIEAEDVTANDRAEITISPSSLNAAMICGMCPTNETLEGIIRIRSVNVPSEVISAEYWIDTGKEN